MAFYETEMSHKNEYDHIIVNDNFENCVKKIHSLIENKRKMLGDVS